MDKKIRTGLQSKISHIFAGVPMPRRKKPLSEQEEPEKKDEISELLQPPKDDAVIEETADEQQIASPEREEVVIEKSLAEKSHLQESQSQTEEKEIVPETLESAVESSIEQKPDEDFTDEEFTVVQEPDFGAEAPVKAGETDKSEQKAPEALKSESKDDNTEDKTSFEHLSALQPPAQRPLAEEPHAREPSTQKSRQVKPSFDVNIPAHPVKEPIVEKSTPSLKQKLEITAIREPLGTQKPAIDKNAGVGAVKKRDMPSSRKVSSKSSVKRLKSRTDTNQPRQKTMIVLIIVLSIVLVLVLGRQFEIFSFSSGGSEPIEQLSPPININKNLGSIKIDWPEPSVYPETIRDPMVSSGQDGLVDGIIEHPDLDVKGTSFVEGGHYQVTIGNDFPCKTGAIIKDHKGRDVKIIDIKKNQVVFEMTSVLWTYDLVSKEWTQNK